MKKWKLLSLALTTFLLLGLCVVGVFAADVTAITAESLAGHQAQAYIVSDLTLPEGITWSSDNPDVISDDGRVSRPLSADAAVTLTGNDGVNEKSFSFTVKAMTTQVIDQENFYYPDKLNQAGSLNVGNWTRSAAEEKPIQAETNGNYYLKQDYSTYSYATSYTPTEGLSGQFAIGFDCQAAPGGSGLNVRLDYKGTPKDAQGTEQTLTGKNILQFQRGGAVRYYNESSSISGGSVTSSEWKRIELSFDMDHLTYNYSLGGSSMATNINLLATSDSINYSDYDWSITQIVFRRAGSSDTSAGTLMLDNFVVTENADVSAVIAGLPDAEKVALYESRITQSSITGESAAAIRSNLTLDAGYSTFGDTGVTVTWRSENPAISDSGVVTAAAMPKAGTVTATIKAGDVTAEKSFAFTTAPMDSKNYDSSLTQDCEGKEGAVVADDTLFQINTMTAANYYVDPTKNNSTVIKASASTSGSLVTKSGTKTGIGTGRFMISADLKYEAGSDEEQDILRFSVIGNGPSVQIDFDFTNRIISPYYWSGSQSETAVMPETLQSGQWFHLDIDMNVMSRSYKFYIDGELLNRYGIPYQMTNARSIGIKPMRQVGLYLTKPGTAYLDNLAVNELTDTDTIKADAAVNAALITYGGKNINNNNIFGVESVLTSASLPSEGPSDGYVYATAPTTENHSKYEFSGGAALSYTVNGVPVSGTYTPSAAGITDITVSAVSNGKTATGSFTRKTAPVLVSSVAYNEEGTVAETVTLGGTPAGKVVLAAYDTETHIMKDAEVYDAAATITANYAIPAGCYLRVYVINASSVQPLSFVK